MKNLAFLSSLLLTLMVFLGSCSKDDTPAPGKEQASFSIVFSGINVDAGTEVTRPNQTKQLTDVLSSANRDKASYVKTGEIQNNRSSIKIEGLKTGDSLSDVTIYMVEGATKVATFDMGKIDADYEDSTNKCLNFLSTIASNLASKKTITLQAFLKGGDKDLSNLKITVSITADFSW